MNPQLDVLPLKNPVLLTCVLKTSPTLWWWLGTKSRIPTTNVAPATCHQTEMLLKMARRWLLKMFTNDTRNSTIMKITKTLVSE